MKIFEKLSIFIVFLIVTNSFELKSEEVDGALKNLITIHGSPWGQQLS